MPIRGRWFRAWRRASALRSVPATRARVVLIDCGVKRAILQQLEALGAEVCVLPYDVTEAELLAADPDAIVVSPGPGDPTDLAANHRGAARPRRPQTALRNLPRSPAAGARVRCAHLQAAVRPSRRKSAGARRRRERGAGHRAQPRLRGRRGLAAERARGDDDQPQRRHERRFSPPLAADRGACSFIPKPRPVRSTLAGSSHDGSTSCRRADRRRGGGDRPPVARGGPRTAHGAVVRARRRYGESAGRRAVPPDRHAPRPRARERGSRSRISRSSPSSNSSATNARRRALRAARSIARRSPSSRTAPGRSPSRRRRCRRSTRATARRSSGSPTG